MNPQSCMTARMHFPYNRKAVYHFVCACCGEPFTAYGNENRKYCSHSCYIAGRFGKECAAND